jgi:hypothetical protein
LARSSTINSAMELAGRSFLPTSTSGEVPIRLIGAKSFWLSYCTIEGCTSLAIAMVLSTENRSV